MRLLPRSRSAAVVVLLVLAASVACGSSDGADAGLMVRDGDRTLAHLTLARLQGLPQVEIATPQSRGAQTQRGPTVRAVLTAAGATAVDGVRVEGRDPAQLLTADLAGRAILTVTKRDTLKLAGAGLDRNRWVRDVSALVVNP